MKKQTKHILKKLVKEHGKYGFNYLYFPSYGNAPYSSSWEAKHLLKLVNDDEHDYNEVVNMYKRYTKKQKAHDKAKEWKEVKKIYYADNSIEVIYEDKDGNQKTELEVAPHGDACY